MLKAKCFSLHVKTKELKSKEKDRFCKSRSTSVKFESDALKRVVVKATIPKLVNIFCQTKWKTKGFYTKASAFISAYLTYTASLAILLVS